MDPAPAKIRRRTHVHRDALEALAQGDDMRAAVQWLAETERGMTTAGLARRLGTPADSVETLLAPGRDSGICTLIPAHPDALWVHRAQFTAAADALRQAVGAYFTAHPTRMNMPREEARTAVAARFGPGLAGAVLAHLVKAGELAEAEGAVRLAGRQVELPPQLAALQEQVLALYERAGATPPLLPHLAGELRADAHDVDMVVAALQEAGVVLRVGTTLAYTRVQWERISAAIQRHFDSNDTLAVADLKDLLGVTRKHAMPIIEYADATGLTIRKGDVRVRGRG